VVDAFWHPKSYVTGAEYRRFAGPTVPLARLYSRTFTTADEFQVPVELYHFGPHPLAQATPYWKIVNAPARSSPRVPGTRATFPSAKYPARQRHRRFVQTPRPRPIQTRGRLEGCACGRLIQPLGTRQQTDNIVTGPARPLLKTTGISGSIPRRWTLPCPSV